MLMCILCTPWKAILLIASACFENLNDMKEKITVVDKFQIIVLEYY